MNATGRGIKLFVYYSLLDWYLAIDYPWNTGRVGQGTGRKEVNLITRATSHL